MTEHKTLVAAQLAVMKQVPYLQKRSSKELSYTFAGEADLIRAIRGAMIEHGMTVTPTGAEPVFSGTQTARSGKEMPHIRLRLTYRFSHAPTGEYVDVQTIGEALDTSDKAANKAMTIGLKYAIRQFFLIETGDDPDIVAHFRDSDNVDWIAKAIKKIEQCRDTSSLDAQAERFRGNDPKTGNPIFSHEQLAELDVYVERRRQALGGRPKAESFEPDKPETPEETLERLYSFVTRLAKCKTPAAVNTIAGDVMANDDCTEALSEVVLAMCDARIKEIGE
jgi:hypothetical protein